jgi:hypothetical protein
MDQDDDCIEISGLCRLTLTAKAESYADGATIPDVIRHQHAVCIPDNGVGKVHNPDRVWSAGFCLGMEMARLAKSVRHFFADWDEVIDGFDYEMRDPE